MAFVTNYRRGVLNNAMHALFEQVMRDVGAGFSAELREFNGAPDRGHLLAHYPPPFPLSRLVNSLKGVSSRLLRQEYVDRVNRARTNGHLWSPSYFAASCAGASLGIVNEDTRG